MSDSVSNSADNVSDSADKENDGETRLAVGHIAGAHGLKGEIRLISYTQEPEAIAHYVPLQDEAGARRFKILSLRPGKDALIVRLEGIADRDAAEALKGTRLYIDRAQLAPPREDEWYHADLIGLVAVSAQGAALGQVVAVQNYGAGDLLELRPATGGDTVLVPFTEAIVPEVDVEGG